MAHRVTKGSKEILALKDHPDHLEDPGLLEAPEGQEQREKG